VHQTRGFRARGWAGLFGLAIASGLVTILLTEVVLRVFHLSDAGGTFTVSEEEFRRVPGIHSPNQGIVSQRGTELAHHITIDSLGYRGANLSRSKPEGQIRIVFAGDSFTWGSYVDDEETLPAQLETSLSETCRPVRVINAGVPSFDIRGETEMIMRSLGLDPDVAIVMFFENDISDMAFTPMWDQLALNREAKSRFPLSVIYPVMRGTALWNLALEVTRSRRIRARTRVYDAVETVDRELSARTEYAHHLAALKDSLALRGIPLVFVAFPDQRAITAREPRSHHTWAVQMARDQGLPVLDLFDTLAGTNLPATDLYLLPLDDHASSRGLEVAAEALASLLADQVLPHGCRWDLKSAPSPGLQADP
jgi:lysophospholipase L1-like esterase